MICRPMIKKFLKKIFSEDFFSDFETVVVTRKSPLESCKHFNGGPQKYRFKFVSRQNSVFSVKIGKAVKKKNRFAGVPADSQKIAGKDRTVEVIVDGNRFCMKNDDYWLVKIRCLTLDPDVKQNILDIYVSLLES